MSIEYKHIKPDRNYKLSDFRQYGIVVTRYGRFTVDSKSHIRVIFRSNGLLGEIRSTCDGNTYAVDAWWGWYSNQRVCLTTECKTLREAKSILFMWFKSKGFVVPKKETDCDWRKNYLKFNEVQLSLNPFIKNLG